MAERTLINIYDEINTADINAIIDKFNAEANRRRRTVDKTFISKVNDEFEALGALANSLRMFGSGDTAAIPIVTENSNCQPFNAAEINADAYSSLKSIVAEDTEIYATFANTVDESLTNLSNQLSAGATSYKLHNYDCSCNIEPAICRCDSFSCDTDWSCDPNRNLCTANCNCDGYTPIHCSCENTCSCEDTCSCNRECCEVNCFDSCSCDVTSTCNDGFVCVCETLNTYECPSNGMYGCNKDMVPCNVLASCSCDDDCCEQVSAGCSGVNDGCVGDDDPLKCSPNTCGCNGNCGCNNECKPERDCCDSEGHSCEPDYSKNASIVFDAASLCYCDSVCSDFYNIDTFKGNNRGYLVCNGVNNTSITLHNMIANGNLSHHPAIGWKEIPTIVENGAGYRAYRSFKVNTATNLARQILFKQFIQGHKYYLSMWCKASKAISSSASIYIGLNDGENGSGTGRGDLGNLYSAGSITTEWKLISGIYDIKQNSNEARISVWAENRGSAAINCDLYVCRFILIDLSAHIGANQLASKTSEEWKIWCDNNIREHHTFVNFGYKWGEETSTGKESSVWTPKWIPEGASAGYEFKGFSYGDSKEDGKEFGDYVHVIQGIQGQPECYLFSKSKNSLEEGAVYYISYDAKNDSSAESSDNRTQTQLYWGGEENERIDEPSMGSSIPLRKGIWKRISFFDGRPFPINRIEYNEKKENTYPVRLDFDNNGYADYMHVTNITCVKVLSNIAEYNKAYSKSIETSIETKDINIYWCDRWIDNGNSTFIHLNNPACKEPSFSNGIVTANDIEIRPEVDTITVNNETGKITCKKLIII